MTKAFAVHFGAHAHANGIQCQQIRNKRVGVLGTDSVAGKCIKREVGGVVSDDGFRTAADCGGENVAVIRIGQR